MKSIICFIFGAVIILLNNTILNFFNMYPKIDIMLIYIILISLYWRGKDYVLCIISGGLGYILDTVSSMYQGQYTILFLVISILGIFIKDEIQKQYFTVSFLTSVIFLIISAIFHSLISGITAINTFSQVLKINFLYIKVNIIALAAVISIASAIMNYRRNK